MTTFAILANNIVADTIVADSLETAQSIYPQAVFKEVSDLFPINIGMIYDGTTFVYPDTDAPA